MKKGERRRRREKRWANEMKRARVFACVCALLLLRVRETRRQKNNPKKRQQVRNGEGKSVNWVWSHLQHIPSCETGRIKHPAAHTLVHYIIRPLSVLALDLLGLIHKLLETEPPPSHPTQLRPSFFFKPHTCNAENEYITGRELRNKIQRQLTIVWALIISLVCTPWLFKRRCILLIFRFIISFWVTAGRGSHAGVPPSAWDAPVSLRPTPHEYPNCSDWSAHTRLSRFAVFSVNSGVFFSLPLAPLLQRM